MYVKISYDEYLMHSNSNSSEIIESFISIKSKNILFGKCAIILLLNDIITPFIKVWKNGNHYCDSMDIELLNKLIFLLSKHFKFEKMDKIQKFSKKKFKFAKNCNCYK